MDENSLRSQGLTDEHLQAEMGAPNMQQPPQSAPQGMPQSAPQGMPQSAPQGMPQPDVSQDNLYDRIEQITESLIDEKWDDFVTEMKKVVAWKDQTEKTIATMQTTLEKMKEDFNMLHQGVLGKINQYDDQIKEVDSELKAVGKVFKDVIPVFTNSVKDLHQISQDLKGGKDGKQS